MRIDAIDLYRVALPLLEPFCTAYGDTAVVETILLRMESEGVEGWGETTPWASPQYSSEWAAAAYQLIRDWLAPRVLGRPFETGQEVQAALAAYKGNPFAKAAIDTAWWDLNARRRHQPLWKLLGGRSPTVDVGADFGVQNSVEDLILRVGNALAEGYKRIKLKFRPGWDAHVVDEVRRAFPDACLHIDCNAAYELVGAAIFDSVDTLGLSMIEQPLGYDDLLDHAELQRRIRTPICLDESISSVNRARQAVAIGACRWINVKPGRVGGITPALEILNFAEQAGVPCWIGGMLESGIGSSHCLALATHRNVRYASDIFPAGRFYADDLAFPAIELSAPSQVTTFPGHGIGCRPYLEKFPRHVLDSCSLQAHRVSEVSL